MKAGINTKYDNGFEIKTMEDYNILGRIGEGAHGIVMKARHRKTGTVVALKKVLLKRLEDGLPETALREIKALQVGTYKISYSYDFSYQMKHGTILLSAQLTSSLLYEVSRQ